MSSGQRRSADGGDGLVGASRLRPARAYRTSRDGTRSAPRMGCGASTSSYVAPEEEQEVEHRRRRSSSDGAKHSRRRSSAERDERKHSRRRSSAERDDQKQTRRRSSAERDDQKHSRRRSSAEREAHKHSRRRSSAEREERSAKAKGGGGGLAGRALQVKPSESFARNFKYQDPDQWRQQRDGDEVDNFQVYRAEKEKRGGKTHIDEELSAENRRNMLDRQSHMSEDKLQSYMQYVRTHALIHPPSLFAARSVVPRPSANPAHHSQRSSVACCGSFVRPIERTAHTDGRLSVHLCVRCSGRQRRATAHGSEGKCQQPLRRPSTRSPLALAHPDTSRVDSYVLWISTWPTAVH
jgi:hypothetical protein